MFLSTSQKKFFVDSNEYVTTLVRTSNSSAPLVIEAIQECGAGDVDSLKAALSSLQAGNPKGAYLHASCGINSSRRVVRKLAIEPKRLKESGYFESVFEQQLRVNAPDYILALLSPVDGVDFDTSKSTLREVVVAGMAISERDDFQGYLLSLGIYPESLELSSIATIGAVVDYINISKVRSPVLILEIEGDLTQSFIVSSGGLESSRPIQQGVNGMVPVVQKELGLRDEASARKLFLSNTFDFTGMGQVLIKKLIKELQSSIGFYEVQTGQSIGYVICTNLPSKLRWIESVIADDLGVPVLNPDIVSWLKSHQISFADNLVGLAQDKRLISVLGLMIQASRPQESSV